MLYVLYVLYCSACYNQRPLTCTHEDGNQPGDHVTLSECLILGKGHTPSPFQRKTAMFPRNYFRSPAANRLPARQPIPRAHQTLERSACDSPKCLSSLKKLNNARKRLCMSTSLSVYCPLWLEKVCTPISLDSSLEHFRQPRYACTCTYSTSVASCQLTAPLSGGAR